MSTPIDLDKMRSIGVIGRRTRPVVTEGREHPQTGKAWKRIEDEVGAVTEHNTRDDRVDAVAKVETIRAVRDPDTGRIFNV
jgi:hypothetical protein